MSSRTGTIVAIAIAVIGFLITVFGTGADFLPGGSPGFSVPQLLLILTGILLMVSGWLLSDVQRRQQLMQNIWKHLAIILFSTIITLLMLEFLLAIVGFVPRYGREIPEIVEPVPWFLCDDAGCRYRSTDEIPECREDEQTYSRLCIVNDAGFHDSDPFIDNEDLQNAELKVLALGDSFTFGASADMGESWVEETEASLDNVIIWNTGIPGAGTGQAVNLLRTYGPIMEPDVAILGFYINDFDDNVYPLDGHLWLIVDDNVTVMRRYRLDAQGNTTRLETPEQIYYRLLYQVDAPRNTIQRVTGSTRLGTLALNTLDAVHLTLDRQTEKRWQMQVDSTRSYLRQLRDEASESDIPLLVLLIPGRDDLDIPGEVYQTAIALLEDLDIAYITPYDMLDPASDYALPPDDHWNNSGHQKAGDLIVTCLKTIQQGGDVSDCGSF